tara:strand:+ start:29325 stop:30485 length:1161 start_codon:yes stop_codon:yes gene_type:complete
MGNNIQISTNINSIKKDFLKKLYSCSIKELNELRQYINTSRQNETDNNKLYGNIEYQIDLINVLNIDQSKLQGQIPVENHNNVNNFIHNVNEDLNSFIYLLQLSKYNESNYNPQEILRLNNNFTLDELKSAYRHFSLMTHPDRPNGSEISFNIVNKAYVDLVKHIELKKEDKPHNELRNNSKSYIKEQNSNNKQDSRIKGSFNINEFNKYFNNDKIETPEDQGYQNWLTESTNDSVKYDKSFNTESFNEFYINNVRENSKSVVKHTIPKELCSHNNNYQELGISKVSNFTGNAGSLNYSDIIEALSNSNIANNVSKRENYNSISHLESERNNISSLTDSEIHEIERVKALENEEEKQRQYIIQQQDNKNFERYDKINSIMLQNVYQ